VRIVFTIDYISDRPLLQCHDSIELTDVPPVNQEDKGIAVQVVLGEVKRKFRVNLDPNDFKTCHYTPNGGIVFRVRDLKYCLQFKAIKSGKDREINIYFNFMLMRRRTNLLYNVGLLRRVEKIYRLCLDFNRLITGI
jgi:hypothetical protein